MSWTLIGQISSKRTAYFIKAANEVGCSVDVIEIEGCNPKQLAGHAIKVDPPTYDSSDLALQPILIGRYVGFIKMLAEEKGLRFLNHPNDILASLDKKQCKQRLLEAGISVTPMLSSTISSYESLLATMREKQIYQVFVKPNNGSGAAGVLAFRIHPKRNDVVLYTSVLVNQQGMFNTKQIRRITDSIEVEAIIDSILKQDAIVEQWVPKAVHNGLGYDLRVVWQFGKVVFIVPRFSKSPITNLHLNNMAGVFGDLQLSDAVTSKIESLCDNAMKLFPRLSYAGIDVLLTKDNLEPMIIEVNGQGDLIYQDIYAENSIYKQQVRDGKDYIAKKLYSGFV